MSNKLHKRNNKKKKIVYNSWPAVLWFSFLDMITSVSTSGSDYAGHSVSLIEAEEHLGELGCKRRDKLTKVIGIIAGILVIALGFNINESAAVTTLFVVLGAILIVGSIVLYRCFHKK